jgi:hypothetical protein
MVGEWGTVSYIIQQIHTKFKGKEFQSFACLHSSPAFFLFFQFCEVAKLAIIDKKF